MKILGYEWKDKKVLVTGAAGFKGAMLCKILIMLGAQVYGIIHTRFHHPLSLFSILELQKEIIVIQADITNRSVITEAINSCKPDVIFHLGAKAIVSEGLRDPYPTYETNIMGTLNILEACRRLGIVAKLIIVSTDHVFGQIEPEDLPEQGFPENTNLLSFGGPYDTSKAAMELIVRSYQRTYFQDLPAIAITRCANVFGYGDTNERRIIPKLIKTALEGTPLKDVYQLNGRQFITLADALIGYIITASVVTKEHYLKDYFTPTFHFAVETYAGTEEPFIRMGALEQLIAEVFGVGVVEEKPIYAPNENKVQALNCAYTRETLNWQPQKTLRKGIRELGDWYANEKEPEILKWLVKKDLEEIKDRLSKA